MSTENYLNHPTFGLLFRVCLLDGERELFTTLYAQRLFFLVVYGGNGVVFDPITRSDARILVENRLRALRRAGPTKEHDALQLIYKQTFQ